MCHVEVGERVPLSVSIFFPEKNISLIFFSPFGSKLLLSGGMSSKRVKGSVGVGEAGKKAKTTPDAGENSVSEKSQVTRTCRNPFEKSKVNRPNFSSVK